MRKMILMAAALGGLVMAQGAFAQDACDPKTEKCPPPKGEECSHGFFKEHPEVWEGLSCGGTTFTNSQIQAGLEAKGAGSAAIREFFRQLLQDCTGAVCTDD